MEQEHLHYQIWLKLLVQRTEQRRQQCFFILRARQPKTQVRHGNQSQNLEKAERHLDGKLSGQERNANEYRILSTILAD